MPAAHDLDHAIGQDLAGIVVRPDVRDVRAKSFGGEQMLVRGRRGGEAEDGRRVQDHGHAVRNDRVVDGVSRRDEVAHHAGHRVGHAVRQVHAGVAEADAGEGRRQQHLAARLVVVGSSTARTQVPARPCPIACIGPDVADRVGALVGGPQRRTLRARRVGERQRGVRLDRVAQHVEPGRCGDLRRHVARVVGIEMPSIGRSARWAMPVLACSSRGRRSRRRSSRCRCRRWSEWRSAV